jgi:hypothetical protein
MLRGNSSNLFSLTMKNATTLIASLALAGISYAGPSYDKAPIGKNPPPPPAPTCNCFEPGGQFSLYAAGLLGAEDLDDAAGAGLSVGYFFTPFVGLEADATWAFTDSTVHSFNGSIVLRYPILSSCLAPYVLGGGGYHVDGVKQGTVHAGAGVDVRLQDCFGIFADARYTWADETDDYTIVRAGIRVNF